MGSGDVVLISAGPSYYASANTVAAEARRAGLYSTAWASHACEAAFTIGTALVYLPQSRCRISITGLVMIALLTKVAQIEQGSSSTGH